MGSIIPDPLEEAQQQIEELTAELANIKKLCGKAAYLFDTSNHKMSFGSSSYNMLLEQQEALLAQLKKVRDNA